MSRAWTWCGAVTCLLVGGCAVADGLDLDSEAVVDGSLDGDGHPGTVLLLLEEAGEPVATCSGVLLSPTVVLTAGHCTESSLSGIRVFYESDVENGYNVFPLSGPNSIEAVHWESHPDYEPEAFYLHDVGVVLLEEPGLNLDPADYATLPDEDALDVLRPGPRTWFTAVGYGAQHASKNGADVRVEYVRMRAEPHLLQINAPGFTGDFSLLLSNNAHTGGTCFGDSGGPNFIEDTHVVAGVTSYGLNGNCAGTGGVFRLDRPGVRSFVLSFVEM